MINKFLLTIILFTTSLNTGAQEAASVTTKIQEDIIWTQVEDYALTMDIYSPEPRDTLLPVVIIFHGGGWLINTNEIMNEMADYMAGTGRYVVCNVNYRLLTANENTTTMNEIIEDAFGAVAWVNEHISEYGGDPDRMTVTGDSAGGQLAAMVVNGASMIGSEGFNGPEFQFSPSYITPGKSIETLKKENAFDVEAVVLSYPATDLYAAALQGFELPENFFWEMGQARARGIFGDSINPSKNPEYYKMVSPLYTIRNKTEKSYPPHFIHVGSEDTTTPPTSVKQYVDSLQTAGHHVEYWLYKNRPHAYLDSGSNTYLGIEFKEDAIPAIERILAFLDGVFY